MHYLSFFGIILIGIFLVKYCKWLRDTTGIRSAWAEGFFGPGGTLTLIKIIGVIAVLFAFYYLFNM